jgi:hypothetical protein
MRFLIHIDRDPAAAPATATATLTRPKDAAWQPRTRTIKLVDDGRGGLMPLPETAPAAAQPHAALCGGDTAQFQKALTAFRSRRSQGADTFGRYLFEVMLGGAWWDAIRDATPADGDAELALSWLPGEATRPFDRLPWELMHNGAQPLVASYHPTIAVTRVVAADPRAAKRASPAPIELPVRVLFVLGAAADDPRIRAATEVLGLLRSLEQPERVQARMIERARPKDVSAAVKAFRPALVHFLCHGDVRDGRGHLELVPDDANDRPECDGARLIDILRPGGQAAPTIVVLGASRSAQQADFDEGAAPLAPQELGALPGRPVILGTLAAELVSGGVPIVVGMGGRVADVAARLFTRRFEASLLEGAPIVRATADARRAPFSQAHGGAKTVDWAYPTLVLHASVDPDYAPTPEPKESGPAIQLRDWAGALQLMSGKQPAFCARHAFLDAFDALFESRAGTGMLAVYSSTAHGEGVRLGKSRLLEQLLFRALRGGHVPVVQRKRRESAPTTVDGLLRELDDDVARTSQHLGVTLPPDLLMGVLASAYKGKPINDGGAFQAVDPLLTGLYTSADAAAKADPGATGKRARALGLQLLRRELQLNGLTGQAACRAIQLDLWEVARSFRTRLAELQAIETAAGRPVPAWLSAPDKARAVLFLDNADLFEVSVLNGIYELVTPGGLGTAEDPIPVVATFTYAGTTQLAVKQFVESAKASCRPLELAPFSPGEDLLVYQRVLLNPYNEKLFDKLGVKSATAFAVNPVELTTTDATASAITAAQKSEELLSALLEGRPDKLGRELYVGVASVQAHQYFVEARDADVLKELGLT